MLEEAANLRKFRLTALYGATSDGVVCRPVPVGALFAPHLGLYFHALLPHSFFLICTLHWCKHCTVLEEAANFRKFRLTALYGATGDGVVCRPVPVVALFAPTQGLHFQALLPHIFHLICTLHWCKHCTVLEEAANLCKFRLTALYGAAGDGVVCRSVPVGALFAPTQGLQF